MDFTEIGHVGLGVASYNRPEALRPCLESIEKYALDLLDYVVVHDDGSSEPYRDEIYAMEEEFPWAYWDTRDGNVGIARSKNRLFNHLLLNDCDWLFLIEDDIAMDDERAITGYIQAGIESGYEHLSFAHHGILNDQPRAVGPVVTLWPACTGGYCMYSRRSLLTCGLMDEAFHNAWEHVEHTQRLALAGFASPHYAKGNADATGSEHWLHAQDVRASLYHPDWDAWLDEVRAMGTDWSARRPATFDLVFPEAPPAETIVTDTGDHPENRIA